MAKLEHSEVGLIPGKIIRMEVFPGIIGIAKETKKTGLQVVGPPNIWIIKGRKLSIVDTGLKDRDGVGWITSVLEEFGGISNVENIIITHNDPDHAGNLTELKRKTPARVISYSNFVDEIDIGGASLKIIRTPGHSDNDISVFSSDGILFTGDTVLGSLDTVTVDRKLIKKYMQSLDLLKKLDPLIIAPGHGAVVKDPKLKIQRIIDHRIRRRSQILDLYNLGIKSSEKIAQIIYPASSVILGKAQVEAHLFELKNESLIK